MRGIYLITMTGTNLYKVGCTKDQEERRKPYITCNPLYKELEFCETYEKSKHKLETIAKAQIEQLGGRYVTNYNVRTEWFEYDGKFSLELLKCCENRILYKAE